MEKQAMGKLVQYVEQKICPACHLSTFQPVGKLKLALTVETERLDGFLETRQVLGDLEQYEELYRTVLKQELWTDKTRIEQKVIQSPTEPALCLTCLDQMLKQKGRKEEAFYSFEQLNRRRAINKANEARLSKARAEGMTSKPKRKAREITPLDLSNL